MTLRFSVFCDSNTDTETTDKEIVTVQILVNNQPVFEFFDYHPLKQSDAKSICDKISRCLGEL